MSNPERKLKVIPGRMRRTRRQIASTERFRRYQMMRARIQHRLHVAGHYAIRLQTVRCVIGEEFNAARLTEALVTFMGGPPVIIPLEALDSKRLGVPTGQLWGWIRWCARDHARKRAAVRHPEWRDPREGPR